MKELKPWQKHSSTWDVPWDERAEQNFDSDKVKLSFKGLSISLSGFVALLIFPVVILSGLVWAINNPRFNENPHFNHCVLVQDIAHPTGSYYKCHK